MEAARKAIISLESRLFGLSETFVNDLLTDVSGYTLHRLQIVVWTLIMGVIFVQQVPRTLAMPEFSETLLWLIAISNGAYLGFKNFEKQVG